MPTYELSTVNKINFYQQITPESCAVTCAAMCVKQSPKKLQADGIKLDFANWSKIATTYGFEEFKDVSVTGLSTSKALLKVVDLLRDGNPVIAKINEGAKTQHWVVITRYAGSGTNPTSNQFTCADPYKGEFVTLSSAPNYVKIYATKYLE